MIKYTYRMRKTWNKDLKYKPSNNEVDKGPVAIN